MSALYRSLVICLVGGLLCGCSVTPWVSRSIDDMPALYNGGKTLTPTQAYKTTESVDILALDERTLAYMDHYVNRSMPREQRARMLHQTLRSPALLGIEYRTYSTYSAQQTFDLREANCLSFASLYIALARHYGLTAHFQMIQSSPVWNRIGDVLAMNIHVNSLVTVHGGYQLVVDIGRDNSRLQDKPRVITDREAFAQFYNNLATKAFADKQLPKAYGLLTRAIDLAPDFPMLWSNLGALYRANQQLDAAEKAYQIALRIDGNYYTALNNLAVLYFHTDRFQQYEQLLKRIQNIRERNPYYHFALAQKFVEENNLLEAKQHIQRAIELKQDENEFQQLLATINHHLSRLISAAGGV